MEQVKSSDALHRAKTLPPLTPMADIPWLQQAELTTSTLPCFGYHTLLCNSLENDSFLSICPAQTLTAQLTQENALLQLHCLGPPVQGVLKCYKAFTLSFLSDWKLPRMGDALQIIKHLPQRSLERGLIWQDQILTPKQEI